MLQTAEKKDKNGVICLVAMLPSWVTVLKLLKKKCIFCNFVLTSARNISDLKQYIYGIWKFLLVFQKMIWLTGVWGTVHEKLAIKISKKTAKTLILDQITFAAVVCFGQVFRFCRLINKSVLEWFLLIMCK